MATYDITKTLNQYFLTNWTETQIQFDGMNLNVSSLDKWISVQYEPVMNETISLNGTNTGRIGYYGLYKVFCYAKNSTKAYQLADSVKTFFNGLEVDNIHVMIGQDGNANNLDNGWYECLCTFNIQENL